MKASNYHVLLYKLIIIYIKYEVGLVLKNEQGMLLITHSRYGEKWKHSHDICIFIKPTTYINKWHLTTAIKHDGEMSGKLPLGCQPRRPRPGWGVHSTSSVTPTSAKAKRRTRQGVLVLTKRINTRYMRFWTMLQVESKPEIYQYQCSGLQPYLTPHVVDGWNSASVVKYALGKGGLAAIYVSRYTNVSRSRDVVGSDWFLFGRNRERSAEWRAGVHVDLSAMVMYRAR